MHLSSITSYPLQPVSWYGYSGSYDYSHDKTNTQTDAMRAQQAIFMAVYHWGIHGWVNESDRYPHVVILHPITTT